MTNKRLKPETKLEKRVLAWCNEIRKRFGKRPVRMFKKGIPKSIHHCPLINTIDLPDQLCCSIGSSLFCGLFSIDNEVTLRVRDNGPPRAFMDDCDIELPRHVAQFTMKFDRQKSKRYREFDSGKVKE